MDTNTTLPQSAGITPRFKGQVLNKIYRVWLWRTFLPVLLAEVAIFSFALYALARAVFFQRIIENAMNVFFQNPSHIFSFFLWAFADAKLPTKILVIGVVIALALVIRQVTQGILRFILVQQNYFSVIGQGKK